MTTPRTIAGQAALSGMRPYVRRALGQTIVAIETEASAPYVEALREADRVLEILAGKDAAAPWDEPARVEIVRQAESARRLARPLLEPPDEADQD